MRAALVAIALRGRRRPGPALDADAALRARARRGARRARAARRARRGARRDRGGAGGLRARRRAGARARLEPEDPDRARGAARVRTRRTASRPSCSRIACPTPKARSACSTCAAAATRRSPPRTAGGSPPTCAAPVCAACAAGSVLDDALFDAERWHPTWGAESRARLRRADRRALGELRRVRRRGRARAPWPARRRACAVDPPIPYLRAREPRAHGAVARPRSRSRSSGALCRAGRRSWSAGRSRRAASAQIVHRSVLDPARYAGALLVAQLEAVGIAVDG